MNSRRKVKAMLDNLNPPPWLAGVFMAFAMAVMRVWLDDKETAWQRIVIEGFICSGFTLAAGSALAAAGYGQNWYLAVGGLIGGLGSQSIRAIAYRWMRKRSGKG